MMPIGELERENAGAIVRGLFDEREQLFVTAGQRADDEDLARGKT